MRLIFNHARVLFPQINIDLLTFLSKANIPAIDGNTDFGDNEKKRRNPKIL